MEKEPENEFADMKFPEFDYESDFNSFMKSLAKKIPKNELVKTKEELDTRFGDNIEIVYNEENQIYSVQLVKIDLKYG